MLGLLGKVGKGLATVLGITGAAAGGFTLALDPSITEGLEQVIQVLTLLAGLLAAFGIGRKAGYAVPDAEK